MAGVKCPKCGANSDLTADGEWAHCASCNNIFEPKKVAGDKGDAGAKAGDDNDDGSTAENSKDGDGTKGGK